jgi:hypothetical protein
MQTDERIIYTLIAGRIDMAGTILHGIVAEHSRTILYIAAITLSIFFHCFSLKKFPGLGSSIFSAIQVSD